MESLPDAIERSRAAVRSFETHLAEWSERITEARSVVADAGRYEAAITQLDDALEADLRVRTRVARTERPLAVTELIGDRPLSGPASVAWDAVAGQIAQHQAAFGVEVRDGTRSLGERLNRAVFDDSHAGIDTAIHRLRDFDPSTSTPRRSAPGISIDM